MSKEYLISEEELMTLIWNKHSDKSTEFLKIKDFLKSKKPMVVIAEGKVKKIYYSVNFIKISFAGLPEKIALGKSLPKNKKVKIILEEDK